MSFFSTILEKIGIKKKAETVAKPVASKPAAHRPVTVSKTPQPASAAKPATVKPAASAGVPDRAAEYMKDKSTPWGAAPVAVPVVDVVSKLEKLAASNSEKLNWKVSIVDLLKLLDIDSSLDARKELANELGCPIEFMGDSAKMNTWLHKNVLQKIAENGGNIPRELLD
ncbi:MAG: oxidoreductase [Chloroflexi bacterium HGW-Chloroflexi-6]|nr:MAG: oxidoreductase [Chloroflexi bacterium HGW-Chloroflexi-6]